MIPAGYVLNSETRCWSRPGYRAIGYSDGDEVENRILNALQQCGDVSSRSDELVKYMVNWPTEYHFSRVRHNLLRPFVFSADSHVLELGCGCGAMTRFFGESGANVTAVEGSLLRAEIAAERCRDLPNVRVICDNLMDFETDLRYEFVTLIGVLEYAPRYISALDPVVACLEKARSFLKPGGVLLLAIENQLGLKYFNGCGEDHIGAPYYGLHGLYRKDDPTTFGRAILEKKLTEAGLTHRRFFYPFPDYKLPQVILSDSALAVPGFDVAALLAGMASGTAEGEFHPNFNENLVWRPIIDNSLLPQLANSYCVLAAASVDGVKKFETEWLACIYATSRTPAYATETRFSRTRNTIAVTKRRLYSDVPMSRIDLPAGGLQHCPDTVSDYIIGRPYLLGLQQRLGCGEGTAGAIKWVAPWLDLLLANCLESENTKFLPGDWVDAIPQNFIYKSDESLQRIDDEWKIERFVPLNWVVIRGLVNAFGISPISDGLRGLKLKDIIVEIAAAHGVCLSENDFSAFRDNEARIRSVVYGCDFEESLRQYVSALGIYPACHLIPTLKEDHHNAVVAGLVGEIARIKSTISWKITKPLRFLAFLYRWGRRVTQKLR